MKDSTDEPPAETFVSPFSYEEVGCPICGGDINKGDEVLIPAQGSLAWTHLRCHVGRDG